jgi:hypothetical protein
MIGFWTSVNAIFWAMHVFLTTVNFSESGSESSGESVAGSCSDASYHPEDDVDEDVDEDVEEDRTTRKRAPSLKRQAKKAVDKEAPSNDRGHEEITEGE